MEGLVVRVLQLSLATPPLSAFPAFAPRSDPMYILQALPLLDEPVPDQLHLRLTRKRLQVGMEDRLFLIRGLCRVVAVGVDSGVKALPPAGGSEVNDGDRARQALPDTPW